MPYTSCKTLALALSSISLFSPLALAQSAPPLADAYTFRQQPSANFGGQPILVVQSGTSSYLQFNLATLPSGATVSKATLRLYVDAVASSGSFDVYQLNSSWNEHELTYNNAPGLGASATGGHPVIVTASTQSQFVLIDVTQLVQAWASNSEPNDGMALSLQGNKGAFAFDSKESIANSHQPELEIALTGSGGPPGAQGPAGPAGPVGPQGSIGPIGPVGSQGVAGAVGPAGLQGSPGAIGPAGPQGLVGAPGAPGPMGVPGLPGPAGANGTNGTNGSGFVFRNAFDPAETYAVNDVATFSGSSYIALAANHGPSNPTPDQNAADWSLMAQGGTGPAGSSGPAGPTGAQGPQGPVGFAGAQGPPGQPGPAGAQGPAGVANVYYNEHLLVNTITAFETGVALAQITLPPGSYMLAATVEIQVPGGAGVGCQLLRSSAFIASGESSEDGAADTLQRITLTGVAMLSSAPDRIFLQCNGNSSAAYMVESATIIASQVNSITLQN